MNPPPSSSKSHSACKNRPLTAGVWSSEGWANTHLTPLTGGCQQRRTDPQKERNLPEREGGVENSSCRELKHSLTWPELEQKIWQRHKYAFSTSVETKIAMNATSAGTCSPGSLWWIVTVVARSLFVLPGKYFCAYPLQESGLFSLQQIPGCLTWLWSS